VDGSTKRSSRTVRRFSNSGARFSSKLVRRRSTKQLQMRRSVLAPVSSPAFS
jgi:hypothetical protein